MHSPCVGLTVGVVGLGRVVFREELFTVSGQMKQGIIENDAMQTGRSKS